MVIQAPFLYSPSILWFFSVSFSTFRFFELSALRFIIFLRRPTTAWLFFLHLLSSPTTRLLNYLGDPSRVHEAGSFVSSPAVLSASFWAAFWWAVGGDKALRGLGLSLGFRYWDQGYDRGLNLYDYGLLVFSSPDMGRV